jgi:G3E family GTPase
MIPLTVIGGFLGSGKTTLVNHLLRSATRRWGVLVNDFGAINVDAALIASQGGDTVALTNGCICCSIGDDLGGGLARLAGVEHVIVEASGVSDPRRIAQLALVEPGFSLEPIVVVVDAVNLADHLDDRWVADTVRGQLAAAEVVLLNKADLAGAAALANAAAMLRAIRPNAVLAETRHGAVDDALLRFPVARTSRFHADTPPDHAFRTWSWEPPRPFDRERLRSVLCGLPRSVLRVKGFCFLAPAAEPHLLQFASGQWALSPAAGPTLGLVAIGTQEMPDDEELSHCFRRALADPGRHGPASSGAPMPARATTSSSDNTRP